MPIPPFDGILNTLPPHIGEPTQPGDLSPYICTVAELCDRFATSPDRKRILEGLLDFRAELFGLGIEGFQWLDGSFLEDIETTEGRSPNDIDAVTFVAKPSNPAILDATLTPRPELWIPDQTKVTYFVDHYSVSLGVAPERVAKRACYWYALFSHRRDGQWKGMLEVELKNKADDDAARVILGNKL